jgi:hypothetical protein
VAGAVPRCERGIPLHRAGELRASRRRTLSATHWAASSRCSWPRVVAQRRSWRSPQPA